MFSPAIEKQRRQLYAQAVRQMGQRLRTVTEPSAMFSALGWGMQELEKTYEETAANVRAMVACRAGCSHCCSTSVDVQAHEVFFAAEYIQLNFSAEALSGVIERTAAQRARRAILGDEARAGWQPCALLSDGQCTIYQGRPEACRVHHTNDATACASHAADLGQELDSVYIPDLRARMFAVMLGMDEAIEAAGFDDRPYDFGAALHEALTNSLCRVSWMQRKAAFSDSCLTRSHEEENDANEG